MTVYRFARSGYRSSVMSPACSHGTVTTEDRLLIKKTLGTERAGWLVGWSLTSLFSTNMAISEIRTKRAGWLTE